ncbi:MULTISPECIES: hypothetical protein [unclassified Bradyrhizobium]
MTRTDVGLPSTSGTLADSLDPEIENQKGAVIAPFVLMAGIAPVRACIWTVSTTTTAEYIPLDSHSVSPALRAGRMDRPGRPLDDNDIVEQHNNPSKEFP